MPAVPIVIKRSFVDQLVTKNAPRRWGMVFSQYDVFVK